MISPAVIEELKLRNPIDAVVSNYVHLERAGQNMKGLCPFHSEKTPSFTVEKRTGWANVPFSAEIKNGYLCISSQYYSVFLPEER